MLIRFKKNFEKISMGLLSFVMAEKDVKKLVQIIREYENNDSWQLFLWKETEDVRGCVGVMQDDASITIQHISVIPSHRGQGLGEKIVDSLKELHENKQIKWSDSAIKYFEKC